jgi:CRISPR-associated protein Cas2
MLVLVTYDVNTENAAGRKRLRQVAKQCQNYGQRVQDSVFECILDPALLKQLQAKLEKIIDIEKDSLRYYYLGDEAHARVEHVGAKKSLDMGGPLIV